MDGLVNFLPLEVTDKDVTNEPPSALVFKTLADLLRKTKLYKVFTGTLQGNAPIYNASLEKEEKVVTS